QSRPQYWNLASSCVPDGAFPWPLESSQAIARAVHRELTHTHPKPGQRIEVTIHVVYQHKNGQVLSWLARLEAMTHRHSCWPAQALKPPAHRRALRSAPASRSTRTRW